MSGPLLVVADTYQDATNYAREHDLGREGPGTWRYISRIDQVLGLRTGRFTQITRGASAGRERDERVALIERLRMFGFEEVTRP